MIYFAGNESYELKYINDVTSAVKDSNNIDSKHHYVLSNSGLSIVTVTDLFDYLNRLSLQNVKTAKTGICTPLKSDTVTGLSQMQ